MENAFWPFRNLENILPRELCGFIDGNYSSDEEVNEAEEEKLLDECYEDYLKEPKVKMNLYEKFIIGKTGITKAMSMGSNAPVNRNVNTLRLYSGKEYKDLLIKHNIPKTHSIMFIIIKDKKAEYQDSYFRGFDMVEDRELSYTLYNESKSGISAKGEYNPELKHKNFHGKVYQYGIDNLSRIIEFFSFKKDDLLKGENNKIQVAFVKIPDDSMLLIGDTNNIQEDKIRINQIEYFGKVDLNKDFYIDKWIKENMETLEINENEYNEIIQGLKKYDEDSGFLSF
jgi:hypothetical protein